MTSDTPLADDPLLKLGMINRCRLVERIGAGAMGTVYRGHHLDLDLDVAIKILNPKLVDQGDAAARFLREARLAARLNHPGIVRVFDCGVWERFHYLVMELVVGQSLEDHLQERTSLPVARALQITQAVAEALREAHEQVGVIHRDIKPANILLTAAGQVKLGDLGLAKMIAVEPDATAQTMSGAALGTPRYMSPEQFVDASRVDHRADQFSLGATFYHMLAGQAPFAGETFLQVFQQVEEATPAPLPKHVPRDVEEIVFRMLEKRPGDRFANYGEVIAALTAAGQEANDTQPPFVKDQPAAETSATLIPAARVAERSKRSAAPVENRVLLVVDVQNDFCPGGALAVPDGDQVVPVINKLARRFSHVILTQDWHCEDHLSFASSHPGEKPHRTIELSYGPQILWPDHCIQGTDGAEFHPKLSIQHCELVIRKGYHREIDSYSAFFENDRQTPTGLAGYLRERGLTRLFVVGLATDFCVAYSALDARRLGFEVTVIEEGCRGIDLGGSIAAAWQQLAAEGVNRV